MFVSACPYVIHRNDLGGYQSMGRICVPRGCPHHEHDARIPARTPATAALSPETSCPGYANTSSVFHPGQLILLTNASAWSREGARRSGSEKADVFQNKAPGLNHKIPSSSQWLQGSLEAVCESTRKRERQRQDVASKASDTEMFLVIKFRRIIIYSASAALCVSGVYFHFDEILSICHENEVAPSCGLSLYFAPCSSRRDLKAARYEHPTKTQQFLVQDDSN